MFVRRSKYDDLKIRCEWLQIQLRAQIGCYDELRKRLQRSKQVQASPQLSQDDIKRMLILCHPDKHGGKTIATEVTQKLLQLRGK